jgi:hypothetical protein
VSNGGVGFATQFQVYDVGSGSMGKTLELFLVNGEEDVVDALTIEVARNQTLGTEGLENGLVTLLANFALKRKMLHCLIN